jgi:hypothetical protein
MHDAQDRANQDNTGELFPFDDGEHFSMNACTLAAHILQKTSNGQHRDRPILREAALGHQPRANLEMLDAETDAFNSLIARNATARDVLLSTSGANCTIAAHSNDSSRGTWFGCSAAVETPTLSEAVEREVATVVAEIDRLEAKTPSPS